MYFKGFYVSNGKFTNSRLVHMFTIFYIQGIIISVTLEVPFIQLNTFIHEFVATTN